MTDPPPWEQAVTVSELKQALDDIPSDTPVAFNSPGYYEFVGDVNYQESPVHEHAVLELLSPGGIDDG